MWQLLTIGFTLGMISSVHCIGMCGPLALSLPTRGMSAAGRAGALAGYHAGRIGAYALLGTIAGLLGRRIYIAGLQHGLSILSGAIILLAMITSRLAGRSGSPKYLKAVYSFLQGRVLRLWRSGSGLKFPGIGFVNGLLPCGMVYIAMAAALGFPSVWQGSMLMICFGAGTLPALLLLHFSGLLLGAPFRTSLRKATPYLMIGMAVMLILRGLNLGIPLISPVLASAPGTPVSCH